MNYVYGLEGLFFRPENFVFVSIFLVFGPDYDYPTSGEFPVESLTVKLYPENSADAPDNCKPSFVWDFYTENR